MSYSVQNIRNVCLLGHSGSGKTALTESLLYMTGAIDRMGRAADGNTVCDYDPEETKRQISITTAVAPIDYKGCRINVLDTPGAFDFAGEAVAALRAADEQGMKVALTNIDLADADFIVAGYTSDDYTNCQLAGAEAAEIIRKEVHKVMRELAAYHYDPEKYAEKVNERRYWSNAGRSYDEE